MTTPDKSGVASLARMLKQLARSLTLWLRDVGGRRLSFRCKDCIFSRLVHGRFQRLEDGAGRLLDHFQGSRLASEALPW